MLFKAMQYEHESIDRLSNINEYWCVIVVVVLIVLVEWMSSQLLSMNQEPNIKISPRKNRDGYVK